MGKHATGIDLTCKYCRVLDKIWLIVVIGAVVALLIIDTVFSKQLAICALISSPIMWWINKYIFREIPTVHGKYQNLINSSKVIGGEENE